MQWGPVSSLSFSASMIFDDSTIDRSLIAPQLNGKRLEGVARASSSLTARWRATDRFTFRCLVRLLGSQFEDDENAISLGEATVVDLSLSYRLDKHAELFLAVDNLADKPVETSRSTNGVMYLSSPRIERGGVRLSW